MHQVRMSEVRRHISQVRHRQGRQATVAWALSQGYAVTWSENKGLVVKALV